MRVPESWLRELVDVPAGVTIEELADVAVARGLEVEEIHRPEVAGPLVVGRVLLAVEEPQRNGKTIRWCSVDVGADEPRGIVCGAPNAETGALVVVSLPGAVLPGGFAIAARKTYGHVSDGMICSSRELGLGTDHDGILRLDAAEGTAGLAPGTDAVALLGLGETVLDLAVTPDRGYCLSMRGVAREIAGALRVPFTDPAPTAGETDRDRGADSSDGPARDGDDSDRPVPDDDEGGAAPAARPLRFRIEDPRCARVASVELTGIDPTATSPSWLSARLTASGLRPVSLVVDVTNLVLVELGQPTHAYDADRLTGQVVVRAARGGERLRTLDGTERTLDDADLVIADDTGPVGLAGVMGGQATEIGPATTRVLVESASFDPVAVARTARRHKLGSEASRRFERGVDPALATGGATRVAQLLADLAGARVVSRDLVGHPVADSAPAALPFDLTLPARVLGTAVTPGEAAAALAEVGCRLTTLDGAPLDVAASAAAAAPEHDPDRDWDAESDADSDTGVVVAPPTWRPDLTDPYDLVEEVGRVVGYDRIPSELPRATPGGGLTRRHRRRRAVVAALVGGGLVESPSAPFVGTAVLDALGIGADDERRRLVRVSNPIAATEPYLRTTLLPGLAGVARRNLGRSSQGAGRDGLALFDVGPVVAAPPGGAPLSAPRPGVSGRPTPAELAALDAALPHQPVHLAVLLTGHRDGGWWGPGHPTSWVDAVGAVTRAAGAVGVPLTAAAAETAPWHPGRCAALSVEEQLVGHAGELHPRVCAALDLPARTAAAEIDLDALFAAAPDTATPVVPSPFPPARLDLALVVGADVPAAAVERAIRTGAGPLVESLRLFDVYTGPQVPPGHRSLAFALELRAPDRTLAEAEVAAVAAAAVAAATEQHGAVLRA